MKTRRTALAFAAAAFAMLTIPSASAQAPARPQTPMAPLPYDVEEVLVTSSADGAQLAGSVTSPRGGAPHAAILLLSVAGPNDRDLSFAGHRAYAVLADRLTRAGFVVLRLDDRGVGGSQGDWTQTGYDTLAADALSAIALLRSRADVDAARVGVFGLSEGAAIAAMAAARLAEPLAFVVLGSPPGLDGEAALRAQFEQTLTLYGVTGEQAQEFRARFAAFLALARAAGQDPARVPELEAFLAGRGRALVPPYGFMPSDAAAQARIFAGPWYQSQLDLAPAQFYAAMRAPALVVGGDRDLILPPAQHHPALRAAAPQAEFAVISGISHLLQPTETGSPAEYARTEITIDPRVLDTVESWMLRVAR